MATFEQRMDDAISKAIQQRIEDIVGLETNNAIQRVMAGIRSEVARISLEIHKQYDIERRGDYLLIRVKMDK